MREKRSNILFDVVVVVECVAPSYSCLWCEGLHQIRRHKFTQINKQNSTAAGGGVVGWCPIMIWNADYLPNVSVCTFVICYCWIVSISEKYNWTPAYAMCLAAACYTDNCGSVQNSYGRCALNKKNFLLNALEFHWNVFAQFKNILRKNVFTLYSLYILKQKTYYN